MEKAAGTNGNQTKGVGTVFVVLPNQSFPSKMKQKLNIQGSAKTFSVDE